MRRVLPVLVLLLVAPAARADEDVVTTGHLAVSGAVPAHVKVELAALGEALYAALVEHFGQAPPDSALPLRLVIDPDRSAAFDTRRLSIRALVNEFIGGIAGQHADRVPAWYREGLAEWFGWHRRTKAGVAFGALDAIAFSHAPAEAASFVARESYDPRSTLDARDAALPVAALALVAALLGTDDAAARRAFDAFERTVAGLGAGSDGPAIRYLGERDALREIVVTFWSAFEPAWVADTPGFDESPEGLVGDAPEKEAVLSARREAVGIRATVAEHALGAYGEAGLVVGREGSREGLYVTLRGDRLRVLVHGEDETRIVGTWPLPAGEGPVTLAVRRVGGGVDVEAARAQAEPTARIRLGWRALRLSDESLPRRVGLVVAEGRARFTDVGVE